MSDCIQLPAVAQKSVTDLVEAVETIRDQRRQVQAIIERMNERERELRTAIAETPARNIAEAEMKLNVRAKRGEKNNLNISAASDLRRLMKEISNGK